MGSQQPYSVEVEDRQFKVSQRAMWAQGNYHESAPRALWEFGQEVVADQLVRVCPPANDDFNGPDQEGVGWYARGRSASPGFASTSGLSSERNGR